MLVYRKIMYFDAKRKWYEEPVSRITDIRLSLMIKMHTLF